MSAPEERLNQSRIQFYSYVFGSALLTAIVFMLPSADDLPHKTYRLWLTLLFFGSVSSFFWSFAHPLRDYMLARYDYGLRHALPEIRHNGKTFAYRTSRYLSRMVYLLEILIAMTAMRVLVPWPEFSVLRPFSSFFVVLWWIAFFALPIYVYVTFSEVKSIYSYHQKFQENLAMAAPGNQPAAAAVISPFRVLGPERFLAGGFKWRFHDFFTNCIVFGGIGTGKTICVLNTLLEGIIASTKDGAYPPSGLILDPKGDYYGKIQEICRKHGRLKDLIVLDPDNPGKSFLWNPLDNCEDALENAANFISTLETTEDSSRETEKFFPQAAERFIRHAIALVRGTNPPDTPPSIVEINALAGNERRIEARLFIAHAVMIFRILGGGGKPLKNILELADDLDRFEDLALQVPKQGPGIKLRAYAATWLETQRTPIAAEVHEILEDSDASLRISDLWYGDRKTFQYEADDPQEALKDATEYFITAWATLSDRVKTSVQATIQNMTDPFTLSPYRRLFSGQSHYSTHALIEQGKILYVHMPIEKKPRMTRIICTFLKLDYYRAALRQVGKERPSFFFCDEFQSFFTVGANKGDANAFERTRASRHVNIISTQNVNALLRQAKGNEAAVHNLLPHCQIKIFLRNDDGKTNQYGQSLSKNIIVNKTSTTQGGKWAATVSDQAERMPVYEEKDFLALSVPSKEECIDYTEGLVYVGSRPQVTYGRQYWKVHTL